MAVLAVGLAEASGADERTAVEAYWLALLMHAGCTADAQVSAAVMEDKPAVQRDMYGIDYASPAEFFPFFLTEEADAVVFRRVKYDLERTREQIYAIAGLDNSLGDRLVEGR